MEIRQRLIELQQQHGWSDYKIAKKSGIIAKHGVQYLPEREHAKYGDLGSVMQGVWDYNGAVLCRRRYDRDFT